MNKKKRFKRVMHDEMGGRLSMEEKAIVERMSAARREHLKRKRK